MEKSWEGKTGNEGIVTSSFAHFSIVLSEASKYKGTHIIIMGLWKNKVACDDKGLVYCLISFMFPVSSYLSQKTDGPGSQCQLEETSWVVVMHYSNCSI